jgi:arylsulfatase A-like enzyme
MSDGSRSPRDVILITVDSLRYDYVFDGSDVVDGLETLGSLGDSGTVFTNAFSNAGYTKSSFLSIFSGTYPWMFESVQGGFGPDRPHVADLFADAGYSTGGFHSNPYLDTAYGYDRGFDFYMGRDVGGDGDQNTLSSDAWMFILNRIGSPRLSRTVRDLYQRIGATFGVQVGGDPYHSAEVVNNSVVRWVSKTSGPRFIWVHYMDVHNPYYPHEGTVSEGISKRRAVKLFHRVHKQGSDASAADLDLLRRLYRGEIEYLDRCIGDLLEDLSDHIDLEDAVLAFTSDHGEAFNEHGYVYHPDGIMYDELVHIPLLIDGPGVESQVVDTPVSNVDVVPTLLSASGLQVPDSCVGSDLRELAADPPEERLVFTEGYTEEDGRAMVTSGDYKLVLDLEEDETVLYDRSADPEERNGRVDDDSAVARRLREALDEHVEMTRRHTGTGRDVDVGDEVKDRLRRLGYAE